MADRSTILRMGATIWETGPALYLDEQCFCELERELGVGLLGGTRLSFVVSQDELTVYPAGSIFGDKRGVRHLCRSNDRMKMLGWPYIVTSMDVAYIVRSGPMILDFVWYSDELRAPIPLPHDLPWPEFHEFRDAEYPNASSARIPVDKHEQIVREIAARRASKLRHTGVSRISVPSYVQALLTPAERVELFRGE